MRIQEKTDSMKSNKFTSKMFWLAAAAVLAGVMVFALGASAGQKQRNFIVTERSYALPEVTLVDSEGQAVEFPGITSNSGRTVISFIFTSCAGICPMITANMARAEPQLDALGDDYQILLISVDPEHDTPERLREYARRFKTGARIRFLTGDQEDVFNVLRSMEALYEGSNKMNHQPVTLISRSERNSWMRIDGLIGSEVLIEQYQKLMDTQAG
ncbi:MAG: SCO family protein [Wenzhouxiangellaceae bacterium]